MNWFRKLFKPKGRYYSDELMNDIRVIWFTNGYDAGYATALKDVEKDKVKTLQIKKDTK